ncbi:uncharacterized protein DS421_1g24840 [Arachis hypogaea]|nr:uncharacterized protein DS421_1g24840 [Arachis hypogaea]
MVGKIFIDDAFHIHTADPATMHRITASFRAGKEQGIGQYQHLSAVAQASSRMPQISSTSTSSYGAGLRLGSQYVTTPSYDYGMFFTSSQPHVTPPSAPPSQPDLHLHQYAIGLPSGGLQPYHAQPHQDPAVPPRSVGDPRPSRPQRQAEPPFCGTGHSRHYQDPTTDDVYYFVFWLDCSYVYCFVFRLG